MCLKMAIYKKLYKGAGKVFMSEDFLHKDVLIQSCAG
jgi:hypothetical protein